MKIFLLIFCLCLFISTSSSAQLFIFGKTMSASAAETKWGKADFNSQIFKSATSGERAKMASAMVRQKNLWIGKSIKDIREELGTHDGYYFTDSIPAYLIQETETRDGEAWQVVFIPDNRYKIKDLIIHRNYPR